MDNSSQIARSAATTTTRQAATAQITAQKNDRPGADREIEWQLSAADLGVVRRWLAGHGTLDGLIIEPRSTLHLHDTYFDTEDWRIHRAGFALRVREASGRVEATLKALRSSSTERADRIELTEPAQDMNTETIRGLTGPVGTRVQAVTGEQALRPLFEARTTRQRFAVRAADRTAELGEIALDETVISRPHGEPQLSLQRVEVEARTSEIAALEDLVKVLREACALEPAQDSKYALGLKAVGLAPAGVAQFASTAIDVSMRIDAVARANLRRQLSSWLAHEPGARLGDDPEQLHDLRLAARRMDAMLSLFKAHLPAKLVQMRARLKKLLNACGEVRDLDVQLTQLAKFVQSLPADERGSADALTRHFESERARARTRMLRLLDSPMTKRWVERLTNALVQSAASTSHTPPPEMAVVVMPALIRSRYKKLRKAADRLTPQSSMDDYHAVRGRAKKLRYAIESTAQMYGKPAEDMLRGVRRLQDRLGVQQDAHVAQSRLRALAADGAQALPADAVFIMGRLAERHELSARGARKRFDKAYRKIRGRRWKALRQQFEAVCAPLESSPGQTNGAQPAVSALDS